jgi:lipopolysaccharide/colanic/teichoic acid biosynthesis glycosyltransferase
MATTSKMPLEKLEEPAVAPVIQPTYVAPERPLRLMVWPAMSALLGLACAVQSELFRSYLLQVSSNDANVFIVLIEVMTLNALAITAMFLLSQKNSVSRLLLPFTISFLTHFVWFAFADDLHQHVAWGFLPATYLATLAFSLAVDSARKLARPKRVGVVALGLAPDVLWRLNDEVELVTDPLADPSPYDVLLLDFAVTLSPEWARFVSSAALANCEVCHVRNYVVQRTACLLPDDVEPKAIHRKSLMNGLYVPIKRCMDIVVTLLIAPMAVILMFPAAVAVAISMGRPVIFTQDRVGRNGRIFRMYKLRTMRARHAGERQTATSKGDNRVTPLGKVLRRYRIDELPQLWNILKGDMSLIGPRPEQPELVAEYKEVLSHYDLRHEVQPGLSGWAQVTYGYASTLEETRMKLAYDLFYIKEFGPTLDLEIAVATLWTLITGRNAR